MKKLLIYLAFIILSIAMLGCSNGGSQLTDDQREEMYIDAIEAELPGISELSILCKAEYENVSIIVAGYNFLEGRYVDYRLAEWKGSELELLGGGGGIAKYDEDIPLSFSTGIQTVQNQEESWMITYGEIYDESIKKIKLVYNDDSILHKEVEGKGYLFIRKTYSNPIAVKSLEAEDENDKVIYHIP